MSDLSKNALNIPVHKDLGPLLRWQAVVLRSIDRIRTYDSNNYETDSSSYFRWSLSPALKGIYRVGHLTFANTVYNVTSNNNTLYIYQGSTSYSGTITPGLYNASTLPTAVTTCLNAINGISGTFSSSYSSVTGKLTITNGTNAFQMDFSADNQGCADVLGFLRHRSKSSALSQTSDNLCNFNPFQSLFMYFENCSNFYRNPNSTLPASGSIHLPLSSNPGSIQELNFNDTPIYLEFNNATVIDVRLRDSAGYMINLGSEFEVQLIKYEQLEQ